MKGFKRTTTLITILLVSVMLFAACGGISVKGEEISKEDFDKVVSTTQEAMKDGYTMITKGSMTIDGKKITIEGKMSGDADGNSYAKIKMTGNDEKAEIEMYATKDGKMIVKHEGKWLAIEGMGAGIDVDGILSGVGANGFITVENTSFDSLEYKNGRYYLNNEEMDFEEGSEVYYAFKDGKYIGGGTKGTYKEDKLTVSIDIGEKITYKSDFKMPDYKDASATESIAIAAEMMNFMSDMIKVMGEDFMGL